MTIDQGQRARDGAMEDDLSDGAAPTPVTLLAPDAPSPSAPSLPISIPLVPRLPARTKGLRVLVLGLNYAPEPTGIAPYTAGMARFLAEAGHDVHVVTGLPHYPHWRVAEGYGARVHREWDGGVRVTRVWHPVPHDPNGVGRISLEALYATHSVLRSGPRPDVVIAVSPALLSVAASLRWRSRGRTAVGVVVQDLYSRALTETGSLSGRGASTARRLERFLLRRADGVVAIHESFRRSLVELGVDADRIDTVRNWSHLDAPTGDVSRFRRCAGWSDREIVVLHAGNMGAKQGLENVVESARLAERERKSVRFVLMGTGSQRPRLEKLAEGLTRIQFLDPLPRGEFETALAAADILLLNEKPGVEEMSVPSKLTSYFTVGRPVLAATSPRSAASSELRVSGAGRRVDPGDPRALLDEALVLGSEGSTAQAMGLGGRVFAASELSAFAARTAYVRWVEGLASRRTSTAHVTSLTDVLPEMNVLEEGVTG